jgi:hypothetical protein
MFILFFFATATDRSSGLWPTCQEPVPAESTLNLFFGSFEANMPSAKGDRQILPKQTIKIFTGMMRLQR